MPLTLFASSPYFFWHILPLVAIVSLVYGATRHELVLPILAHAYRTTVWVLGFMAVVFAILFLVSQAV